MLNVRGLKSMKFGVFFVDLGMCVLAARSLTVLRHRSQALWHYTFVMCSKHGYIHLFIKNV